MKTTVALLATMLTVGGLLALAADPPGKGPVIIKGSADTDEGTVAPARSSVDLVGVDLNEVILAKREAAMDAVEKALEAEIVRMVAENKRRKAELADWRAKERARVGR